MELEKFSFGIGDRFGMEGEAQLRALQQARDHGIDVVPVWNKSNREHVIIGTSPWDTRREADRAVRAFHWTSSYYVDADHIGLATVDGFLEPSDFFTIDVADFIGKPADAAAVSGFLSAMKSSVRRIALPDVQYQVVITDELLQTFAENYLLAVQEAGRVYRAIAVQKGAENFVAEISFDEAEVSQTPEELFLILAAVAKEKIRLQTIAPKFVGKFLKGVDYVGDVAAFARQFELDVAVIRSAVETFDLPASLKLSVHSGSDKFSLYPSIHKSLAKHGAGIHVKTAGTTWLEELIGLVEGGSDGLEFAKRVYRESLDRYDLLVKPYLAVVDIQTSRLPTPSTVNTWTGAKFAAVLRHDPACKDFSADIRQLLHVGYRIAAEQGDVYMELLKTYRKTVERNVAENLFQRHLLPIFGGGKS